MPSLLSLQAACSQGMSKGKGFRSPAFLCLAPLMTKPCSAPPQTFCLQCRLRLFLANPPPSLLSFHLRLLSLLLLLILHTLPPSNFPEVLLHRGIFLWEDQRWHCQHYYSLFTVDEVGFQER